MFAYFLWCVIFTFNSPGTIVCSTDNFPFWAKILTDITPTYYRFWKLISYLKSRTSFLVLLAVIRFLISFITWENASKQKSKYEKGKSSVPGELRKVLLSLFLLYDSTYWDGHSETIIQIEHTNSHIPISIVWQVKQRFW